MRKALSTSTLLISAILIAASCSEGDKSDPHPAFGGGSAGTAGGIGVGDAGADTGAGGDATGAGGGDGTMAPPGCTELVGLGDCGVTSMEAEYRVANIMLVIDKSKSMVDQPTGFDLDKWEALKAALDESLTNVAGEVNFGLILYPYSLNEPIPTDACTGDICCEVPPDVSAVNVGIDPSTDTVPAILDALDGTEPSGGTPTAAALESAYEYFVNGDGATLGGDRYVLLATDGGPNCNADNSCNGDTCTPNLDDQCSIDNCCSGNNGLFCLDDQSVVAQIEALYEAGIPTFVIGIPGTEVYASYLDTFATAGGEEAPGGGYYAVDAMGGVEALAQTFTDITTHLVRSCDIELATQPPNLDLVNVAVDCEVIPSQDGAGWEIPADDPTHLILKGNACTYIETEGAERVDVVYGCPMIR